MQGSGSFTVSLEQARAQLAEHLLESADESLLKIVQAGVALGAKGLHFGLHPGFLRVELLEVSLSEAESHSLFSWLLAPHSGTRARGLRHLASAINTCVLTSPFPLALCSWDGEKGTSILWHAQGVTRLPDPPPQGRSQTWLELRRTGSEVWLRRLKRWLPGEIVARLTDQPGNEPERRLLYERARWCPVPILLNGRPLPPPPVTPPNAISDSDAFRPQVASSHWIPLGPEGVGIRSPQGGIARALIAWGMQPVFGEVRSQIVWVCDGVTVETQFQEGTPRGDFRWVVASCDGLNTDLTGLRLLRDATRQAMEEFLWQQFRDLRRGGKPLPPDLGG